MAKKKDPYRHTPIPGGLTRADYDRLNRMVRRGLLPVEPTRKGIPRDFSELTPTLLAAGQTVLMFTRHLTPEVRAQNNCSQLGDVVRRLAAGGDIRIGPATIRLTHLPQGD